jgi:hypothetical protein
MTSIDYLVRDKEWKMKVLTIIILIATVSPYADVGAICGTVRTNDSDFPIEGALVVLAGGKFDIMFRDSTYTNGDGGFCFENLPSGSDYNLYVMKSGFLSDGKYPVFAYGDSVVKQDFSLEAAQPVSGTVIDEQTGNPLKDAIVCTGNFFDTTDSGGEFLIPDLPAGRTLQVRKPGYLTTGYEARDDGGTLILQLPPVPEGMSDLSHLEILVSDFAPNKPISGAAVSVKLVKTQNDSILDTMVTTGPDGLVRLTGLPHVQKEWEPHCFRSRGEGYLVRVSAEGYRDGRIGPFGLFENEIYRVNVLLKKEVVLHTRVLDTEGRPVHGAKLARFDLGQAHYSITDANGWSSWDGFLPGEYDITIAADGMETKVVKSTISGENFSDTQMVNLQAFDQGKTLSGVLVSENNEPLEASKLHSLDSVVTFTANLHHSMVTLVTFRDSATFHFNGIPLEVDSGFVQTQESDKEKVFLEESGTYVELRVYPQSIDTKRNSALSGDRPNPFLSGVVLHLGGCSSRRYIVKLFDMRGRQVYRKNVMSTTGFLDFSKEVPELSGFFACSVTDEKLRSQSFPLLLKK